VEWGSSIRRRLLLAVAVETGGLRDPVGARAELPVVLARAAHRVGLHREAWQVQPVGTGELAVLPGAEPGRLVVDELVRALDGMLADHNRGRVPSARLRLRVAVHFGVATPATQGYAGTGVDAVCGVLDSEVLRRALAAAAEARIAVALTSRVFEDLIVARRTSLETGSFRRVGLRIKDRVDDVWLHLPGYDVHGLDLNAVA
jgi:hypothetical protein